MRSRTRDEANQRLLKDSSAMLAKLANGQAEKEKLLQEAITNAQQAKSKVTASKHEMIRAKTLATAAVELHDTVSCADIWSALQRLRLYVLIGGATGAEGRGSNAHKDACSTECSDGGAG